MEEAMRRLNQAVDMLELALGRHQLAGRAASNLEVEMQALSRDRSRLAQEIDRLRERNARLEQAQGEASERVDHAIEVIEEVLESTGG